MQIVETLENLSDYPLNIVSRYTPIIRFDYKLEKIVSKNFEHHTHMETIYTGDLEIIQQLYRFIALWIIGIGIAYIFQKFYLVQGRLGEMRCRFNDFESNKSFVLKPFPPILLTISWQLFSRYTIVEKYTSCC